MTDTLNQQPAGNHALLVKFSWGNNHVAAYTSWSDPVTIGPDVVGGSSTTYAPEPRLEVESGKQSGLVKDEPWQVTLPATSPPLNYLARPSRFGAVTCRIAEVDPAVGAAMLLWQGTIGTITLYPKDKPGCIRADVGGVRGDIQFPLGIESKTACSRTFGDPWCGFNLAAAAQPAVITAVSGHLLSAPGLTIPSGKPANYFSYGKAVVDNLPIGIVDGSGGPGSLRMFNVPPPEWIGATAVFTPGCDKSFPGAIGCTGHNNTARFFGIGNVKPSGSPLLTPR